MSARAEQFHATPWIGVLYITGGGSGFIEEQLSTPGASASILEVQVPYANLALTQLLGRPPEQACSTATARQMAVAAFERAQSLQPDEHNFGFGCTASLATNRTKKGQHRAHWAIQTATISASFSAEYDADRVQEEALLVEQIWDSIAHVLLDAELSSHISCERCNADATTASLYQQALTRTCSVEHDGKLILPGSFNPLHAGHQQMMLVGEQLTGLTGAFELTVKNADKPNLDFLTLAERKAQFHAPLWITNAATYAEKSALFPATTFLLGVDTLSRIAEIRFYDDRQDHFEAALETFVTNNIRFLVFGRQADTYITLSDLVLPESLKGLCTEVDEQQFRMDISSTALRNQTS